MTRCIWIALVFWSVVFPVYAAETCVTIPTSTWTQEQKNYRVSLGYKLLFNAGDDIVPTLVGDTICVANPTVDITAVLTSQKILDQYAVNKAASDAATQVEQARQQVFTDELATNTLCQADLADLDTHLDVLIDPVTTLAEAKTAIKTALKKVARCMRARAR